MAVLFEYGNWIPVNARESLQQALHRVWQQRHFTGTKNLTEQEGDSSGRYQPFLCFDGENMRANNFTGFIQHGEGLVEIYPKVFRHLPQALEQKPLMLRHIFYWLEYCRKWRFPFSHASLGTLDIDSFPELIIHLIASQCYETVSSKPLAQYQEREEALQSPRGTINFKRYSSQSLSRGNFHAIECDFTPLSYDNQVNRIIKYCCRLLMGQTRRAENLRVLQDVLSLLDEVEDIPCSFSDAEGNSFNLFYEEYTDLMDSCKLVLSQQLYVGDSYKLSQWSLLLPMEYIFEDFLAGFLKEKFGKEWEVKYQKSDMYLSNTPEAFNMQHDIFLTARTGSRRRVIIDTKYKLRSTGYKQDIKKEVSQDDLYQMVSYAYKRGCTDVLLVYPNIAEHLHSPDTFDITSGFEGQDTIRITAMEIPFWSFEAFGQLEQVLYATLQRELLRLATRG